MGDPADVGLVDAHAEGDGGHDDQPVLALKPRLDRAAVIGVHAAVIMAGGVATLAERLCQRFGLCPRAAIDDAGLPLARGGEVQDLAARLVLDLEGEADVRPVEAAQEGFGCCAVEEAGDDLGPRFLIRGGGEGGKRHVQRPAQIADAQVIGAEIVAPLTDAMRLIHRDQRGVDAPEERQRTAGGQPFGRHVEQLQPPFVEGREDLLRLLLCIARGQRASLHPRLAQAAHLVAHQRDEGGNDDGHAIAQKGGKLETQRLATTRRHDGQRVPPARDGGDDLRLSGAEGGESEDGGQKFLRLAHRLWAGCSFPGKLSQRPDGGKAQ